jgi:hypothetical protein
MEFVCFVLSAVKFLAEMGLQFRGENEEIMDFFSKESNSY